MMSLAEYQIYVHFLVPFFCVRGISVQHSAVLQSLLILIVLNYLLFLHVKQEATIFTGY